MNYGDRIEINADVHFGKPYVSGTRVPVANVLELVQEGIPFDTIVEEYYPAISAEDVRACVQYATDIIRSEEVHARRP